MGASRIEWTEKTWNPVTGCTPASAGCANCYARAMAGRLTRMGNLKYADGFKVACHPDDLGKPGSWRKPCMVFVCSMGDLFHEDVPEAFIGEVMDVIGGTGRHTFQILTKRPAGMAAFFRGRPVPPNAWLGTTVEDASVKGRIDALRSIDAPLRFLSCEPLLGDLGDIDLSGIGWVIAGGETGPNARPMRPEWPRGLRVRVKAARIPFFFKQWGAWGPDGKMRDKRRNGYSLDGLAYRGMPRRAALQGKETD
jgi:protein gp37